MMKNISLRPTLILAAACCGGSLQAQLIPDIHDPWTASGSAAPAKSTAILELELTPGWSSTSDSASAGPWSLQASGIVQARVGTPALPPLVPEVVLLDVGSRAQSSVDSTSRSLNFGLDNWADVGSLNLGNLLGAGVAMTWQADLALPDFNWSSPQYELDFLLTAPSGLLSNVADLSSTLNVSVFDGDDRLVHSVGGAELIDLLGITLGNPVENGPLSLTFAGDDSFTDGLTLRFEASSLVNTSLLGTGSNVATFSGLSLAAVPEPGTSLLAAMALGSLLRRRRV